jgi:D-alanyl-D-alanine carboxypeptidase
MIEVHPPDTWFDLQSLLDSAVEKVPEVHAVALHVDAPGIGLVWDGAAGLADPTSSTEMTPQHPVRIASNTKTFVAAAVLRLVEEGRLSLDDPISEYLPDDFVELLRGDGYSPEKMTVRHLLTHTSGLFDHSDSENYEKAIIADPVHRWTRAQQLRAAVEWGDRLGAPGEIYSYCDTGYVLLGEILEQASGRPLAVAVRELVGFEQLDLRSIWWETLEQRPGDAFDRAHQYLGDLDVTDFDPSYDLYGGGGLSSTMRDLARFFRGLFTGAVFVQAETADIMLTTVDGARAHPEADETSLPVGAYRMGIWVEEVSDFTAYRHGGFWGTTAIYVPDLDLTIAATVNQNSGKQVLEDLVRQVIALVGERMGC